MNKMPITREEMAEIFFYNKDTGELLRKLPNGKLFPQRSLSDKGYIRVQLKCKTYQAHRIIWYMETGEEPEQLDHINGVRTDNRLGNLRSVNTRQNLQNLYKHREGKLCGSSHAHGSQNWEAHIRVDYQNIYLGSYKTEAEASAAYWGAVKTAEALRSRLTEPKE